MTTKREQLAKPHDQLSKHCGTRQDNSTFVFLTRVLAILKWIQLPLSVTSRFINELFVSLANMAYTSD